MTNINQKLRDDMLYFYGNLDSLEWASMCRLDVSPDMIAHMKAQYESILERLFEDFDDD